MRCVLSVIVPLTLITGIAGWASAEIVPHDSSLHSMTPPEAGAGAASFASRTTDDNLVHLTVTNYGFVGNNFVIRTPSFEYPFGTGYEHMPRAGLWVGATAIDSAGVFAGVTTGAADGSIGASASSATEFTPRTSTILVRSTLPSSVYYDPHAVSEQDYVSEFDDLSLPLGGVTERHRPLGVAVRQEAYSWSFGDLRHFVVMRFVVRNLGLPLHDAWVGLYTELASGPKNSYSTWPPSTAGGGSLGGWFGKKLIGYDDSHRLIHEHYCTAGSLGVPTSGPPQCACVAGAQVVPYYAGVMLLGISPGAIADADKHVTVAAWNYDPFNTLRDEDVERYALMSAGTVQELCDTQLLPGTGGDPEELMAVGPFTEIDTGDSVTVDFAFGGGAELGDLQAQALGLQRFYDSGFDLTTPTQPGLVSARSAPGEVRLAWDYGPGAAGITVERRETRTAWQAIGQAASAGAGLVTYTDHGVAPGERYGYRVNLAGRPFGEVWVDVPHALALGLAGARPNPAKSAFTVEISLPDASPARLEVLDLAGRRLIAREVGALGSGSHTVKLSTDGALAPGVYLLRVTSGRRSLTTRALVVR